VAKKRRSLPSWVQSVTRADGSVRFRGWWMTAAGRRRFGPTPREVEWAIGVRQEDGVGPQTIAHTLAGLRRCFRVAIRAGAPLVDPTQLVTAPKVPLADVRPVPWGALNEAVAGLSYEPHRLAATLVLRTGLRAGEVARLTADSLAPADVDGWGLLHVDGKVTPRTLPAHPHLVSLLDRIQLPVVKSRLRLACDRMRVVVGELGDCHPHALCCSIHSSTAERRSRMLRRVRKWGGASSCFNSSRALRSLTFSSLAKSPSSRISSSVVTEVLRVEVLG